MLSVITTRHAPAANRHARCSASISRMYWAFTPMPFPFRRRRRVGPARAATPPGPFPGPWSEAERNPGSSATTRRAAAHACSAAAQIRCFAALLRWIPDRLPLRFAPLQASGKGRRGGCAILVGARSSSSLRERVRAADHAGMNRSVLSRPAAPFRVRARADARPLRGETAMNAFDADLRSLAAKAALSRREVVVTSLATGFALAVQPVCAQTTITTDANGLEAGEVSVRTQNGDIPAYRAMPASGGPFPVALVVQEIFGVHEHIKDVCRRFAKLGYVAIAPELYARQGDVSKTSDVQQIIREVVSKVPDEQVMSDLDATVASPRSGQGRHGAARH